MIVAFLQNPWFPPATDPTTIEKYRTNQEFHRRILSRTMSGQRLRFAFGEAIFNEIWWDNANPRHVDNPRDTLEADLPHMEKVIMEQRPILVLTFGKQAGDAIEASVAAVACAVLKCHHPNARFHNQTDLDNFAAKAIAFKRDYLERKAYEALVH